MRKFLMLMAVALVLPTLAGLAQAGERLKIGLALPTQQEERWVRDMHAMQAEADKYNVDLRIAIARNDQAQQNNQIDQLLSQGIRVLILAPHDGEGAATSVNKAHEDGIKVISYDRLIMGTDVDVYMSFDNVRVGELMGEWITKRVPKGDYILMSGAPTDNNAKLFKQGHMNFIQPLIDKGDIKVILDQPVIDWQPANAQRIVENALTLANNKVDAILAPNDGTASGAIAALRAQGLAGKIPVTGQDAELSAAQRIVQGTQSITVLKDTRKLGEEAIRLAIRMAKGEDISDAINGAVDNGTMEVSSVLLEAQVVDKDNIDAVLIESGYLKRSDVYGN
ncbi:MAG: substrate-binding domain-containing protein [Planctomycetes bacterium]|nr:substrate-binding domain-containing protein [Planctomycetota bacterium]MCC8116467.1 substrate-binding domain-containing protein [Planctomycetota bacterium]